MKRRGRGGGTADGSTRLGASVGTALLFSVAGASVIAQPVVRSVSEDPPFALREEVLLVDSALGDITDIVPGPAQPEGTLIVAGARAAARWRPGAAHEVFVRFDAAWEEDGRDAWNPTRFGPSVIDLDGDGTPEFVDRGNENGRTLIHVLEFDGKGRFKIQLPTRGGFNGSFVVPIDRDGDGRTELIAGNGNVPYAGVWASDGTFLNEIDLAGQRRIHGQTPIARNVNADGIPDLVYGSRGGLIAQDSHGKVLAQWPLPPTFNYVSEIEPLRPDGAGAVRFGLLLNGRSRFEIRIDSANLDVNDRPVEPDAPWPIVGEQLKLPDGRAVWARMEPGRGFARVILADEVGNRVTMVGITPEKVPRIGTANVTERGVMRRHAAGQDQLIVGFANSVRVLALKPAAP